MSEEKTIRDLAVGAAHAYKRFETNLKAIGVLPETQAVMMALVNFAEPNEHRPAFQYNNLYTLQSDIKTNLEIFDEVGKKIFACPWSAYGMEEFTNVAGCKHYLKIVESVMECMRWLSNMKMTIEADSNRHAFAQALSEFHNHLLGNLERLKGEEST